MKGDELHGKVVLVSGVGGDIGAEVAACLRDAGARLSVCDLPTPEAGTVAEGLDDYKSTLGTLADLSDPQAARHWTDRTLDTFGRIDALVNVAGFWRTRPFLDVTPEELAAMWAGNLQTAFWPCHAVAPHLVGQGGGSIVNFASTAGQYGSIAPGAHYAAAKGAVIGLTKSLARELSPLGVRVNAVSPGPVHTTALGGGASVDLAKVAQRTLLGRLGTPRDIALAVRYLVSDAASWVTGQVIGVNGGSLL